MLPEEVVYSVRSKFLNERRYDWTGFVRAASINSSAMPTVSRTGPHRFYFYSHKSNEPPHAHVGRDDLSAKFWLEPVALVRNLGFDARELRRLQSLVTEHQTELLEAWHEFFGADG